jgi:integrase
LSMKTRRRLQKGSITLIAGVWYVRYYAGPKASRRMVRHRLADKSDKFHSASCLPVRQLAQRHMSAVNEGLGAEALSPKIKEFFEGQYMPWVERAKKHSTRLSYKNIWEQHLEKHFGEARLDEYETLAATTFLTKLAEKYNRNTIAHVRSSMSGIFTFAGRRGLIKTNPIHFAEPEIDPQEVPETSSYSVREVEDMISALKDSPDAALVVALCGFLGTRPSECAAIKWSDIDSEFIHLRRGLVRGKIDDLKTKGSVRDLPIIDPVRILLELQPTSTNGWLFENQAGGPRDLKDMVRKVIRPAILKWNAGHGEKLEWRSLYAFRRAASSTLWSLTKSVEASQLLLGHTTPNVTMRHYLKANKSALTAGLKQLEDALRRP